MATHVVGTNPKGLVTTCSYRKVTPESLSSAQELRQLTGTSQKVLPKIRHSTGRPGRLLLVVNGRNIYVPGDVTKKRTLNFCLWTFFSKFDMKFGREVDLDELSNVIKGTFQNLHSILSYPISKIWQNSADRLITFEPPGPFWPNLVMQVRQTSFYLKLSSS